MFDLSNHTTKREDHKREDNKREGSKLKAKTISHDKSHQQVSVELQGGTITVHVHESDFRLDQLTGFASRANPKRRFLFVSKVLGKHLPVRPSMMKLIHQTLADKLPTFDSPTLFVGLAETATGLGQGVYEEAVCRQSSLPSKPCQLLYQHTTRFAVPFQRLLQFHEPHSHAIHHILYQPTTFGHQSIVEDGRSLVLIDDEISTGTTLSNLSLALIDHMPKLESLHIVCLTNWMSSADRTRFQERVGPSVFFHQLLNGDFKFVENSEPPPPEIASHEPTDITVRLTPQQNATRFATDKIQSIENQDIDALMLGSKTNKILVLGTGEFAHLPYRLAYELEQRGHDVYFQSTTRSPIQLGHAIESRLSFVDNYGEGITNYLYNVASRTYDKILVAYEQDTIPTSHQLPQQLNAAAIGFYGNRFKLLSGHETIL